MVQVLGASGYSREKAPWENSEVFVGVYVKTESISVDGTLKASPQTLPVTTPTFGLCSFFPRCRSGDFWRTQGWESSSHTLRDGISTLWAKNVAQRLEDSLHPYLHSEPQMSGSWPRGVVEHYKALYSVVYEDNL